MFILGLKRYNKDIIMSLKIPDIRKQIYKEQTFNLLENKYSIMGPMWVNYQMQWCNGVYATFKDHDKFLIIIFLIKKTLDFYSRNFTKLTYDEFYSKDTVEIEEFTIKEISQTLSIPKESARRKVSELEKDGVIKKYKKRILIDRSKFYYSKPENSIKRIGRFLSTLSEICKDDNILPKKISTEELELVIKNNFSYIWKIYYEMQIPMMIIYKKIFKDLETFHIFGTCIVNQHLSAKKISNNYVGRDAFIKSTYSNKAMQGLNAMSISDITGIPRATVIRKLQKLVKRKNLQIDEKKHYKLSGNFVKILKPVQKSILIKLGCFSSKVFNLSIL